MPGLSFPARLNQAHHEEPPPPSRSASRLRPSSHADRLGSGLGRDPWRGSSGADLLIGRPDAPLDYLAALFAGIAHRRVSNRNRR